ncbi:MAG: metallophosphoesterase family protein [Bacteroidales bacterium]
MKIGILSDTHGHFDPRIEVHFKDCDEIWHAGDIGDMEVIRRLHRIAPVVAVHGNIDGYPIRGQYPAHQRLIREGVDIWMTHIGGYPGNYDTRIREAIRSNPPNLFISGHSHILKVIPDKRLGLLHMNPGAAGRIGMHKTRTLIRAELEDGTIRHADVIDLGSRSSS